MPNPSYYGQQITFTVTVSPAGATRTVMFQIDGGCGIPYAYPSGPVLNGVATLVITPAACSLARPVYAKYTGDANFLESIPFEASDLKVSMAGTTTTLAASPSPAASGQTVTLTAMVAPSTATGSVTFMDGATTLGASPVSGGTASIGVPNLAAGSHPLTAAYSGDANYFGSSGSVNEFLTDAGLSIGYAPPLTSATAVFLTASLRAASTCAGTPVGAMASVHCAAATANFLACENHSLDVPWWNDLVEGIDEPIINKGWIKVPDKPGLGITLNVEVVRKHLAPGTGYFDPTPLRPGRTPIASPADNSSREWPSWEDWPIAANPTPGPGFLRNRPSFPAHRLNPQTRGSLNSLRARAPRRPARTYPCESGSTSSRN